MNGAAEAALVELNRFLADPDEGRSDAFWMVTRALLVELDDLSSWTAERMREELLQPYEQGLLTDTELDAIAGDLLDVMDDPYHRDDLSHMAMSFSLCPLHFRDWASCFDDEDPECEQIRLVFPHSHDT